MYSQAPKHVLMIRPAAFGSNPETHASNTFQQEEDMPKEKIQELALEEFDKMVSMLNAHDVATLVADDSETPTTPDAIFPNNWVSMQPDGKMVIYPMMAPSRRLERSEKVLELIKGNFKVSETLDFSPFENESEIVEGTGSIIFDHVNKIAYAARSPRTTENLTRKICDELGYEPVLFNAIDSSGTAIYHTNVVMAVATEFVVICLDSIHDETDQEMLLECFNKTGHKVIAISVDQMQSFAGNILEVMKNSGERLLIISERAVRSLVPGQLDAITKFVDILPISIPTIEKYSGGSVRCMLAGIHFDNKE